MGRIAAVLAALVLAGCSSGTGDPAVDKFNDDVGNEGIATSLTDVHGNNLGKDICTDIRGGQSAPSVLATVSENPNLSTRAAEIITYYAITDICPDEIGQRQEDWREGK